MQKPEIREIAHSLGLKVADKVDSQEICFVPGNDYKAFLRSHLGDERISSRRNLRCRMEILSADHEGIEMFTIGQRKGIARRFAPATLCGRSRSGNEPRHRRRRGRSDLRRIRNRSRNWMPRDRADEDCREYGQDSLQPSGDGGDGDAAWRTVARVIRLHEPQRAVTPGQAAVFYDGDVVLRRVDGFAGSRAGQAVLEDPDSRP